MSEDLQSLLDRIQKDGVDKAETRAAEIIAAAESKAKNIVSEAQAEAKRLVEKADQDSTSFAERGKKSIEQAGRDVVLTVENAVTEAFERILAAKVKDSLTGDVLKEMLGRIVEAYCTKDGSEHIQVLVNPADEAALKEFMLSTFAESMNKGLVIKGDSDVISGLKVSLVNADVHHDFSADAITEALCHLLRPQLTAIMKGAGSASSKG